VKRAGRAVELRPAPKGRNVTHPQQRQHSAEGGTRDRVRPAGAHMCGACAARVRDRHPNGRRRVTACERGLDCSRLRARRAWSPP